MCELRLRQLQCVACWPIEMYSSGAFNQLRHFSPSTLLLACTCACVHACIRTWSSCVCVCVYERALHERIVCVRAVCVLSRACLRVDVSCACVGVACARSRACVALTFRVRARRHILCVRSRRVCALTSVRVQPSCVRVHERARAAVVCSRSRACVRVHERACASTSPVRVRRVRAVTSVMDLRSISGR